VHLNAQGTFRYDLDEHKSSNIQHNVTSENSIKLCYKTVNYSSIKAKNDQQKMKHLMPLGWILVTHAIFVASLTSLYSSHLLFAP
jgi:hypothetical protein